MLRIIDKKNLFDATGSKIEASELKTPTAFIKGEKGETILIMRCTQTKSINDVRWRLFSILPGEQSEEKYIFSVDGPDFVKLLDGFHAAIFNNSCLLVQYIGKDGNVKQHTCRFKKDVKTEDKKGEKKPYQKKNNTNGKRNNRFVKKESGIKPQANNKSKEIYEKKIYDDKKAPNDIKSGSWIDIKMNAGDDSL